MGWLSLYPCPLFEVFPGHAPMTKYTKTDIMQPSDGLYTWVRPNLAWKVELYTFSGFLCMTLLLWGILDLGPISPNYLNAPNTV